MFDQIQVYSGKIASDINYETPEGLEPGTNNTSTVEEQARAEAERLLQEARNEADALLEAAKKNAEIEAEKIIAERINAAAFDFAGELGSSKLALAHITEIALHKIVGKMGKGEACLAAVETAVTRYLEEKALTIRVASDNIDRLKLAMMTKGSGESLPANIKIKEDPSLEAGRCILQTQNQRFEIGINVQIEAFANVAKSAIKNMSQNSGSNGGAL